MKIISIASAFSFSMALSPYVLFNNSLLILIPNQSIQHHCPIKAYNNIAHKNYWGGGAKVALD
jgi:hypothetical protein